MAGLRLKFRTGGLTADAFPSAAELAACIDAALDRETPFKCTAGLHHAVRHTDPETGFEHHGFLNVLLATRVALDGGRRRGAHCRRRRPAAQLHRPHARPARRRAAGSPRSAPAACWTSTRTSCELGPLEGRRMSTLGRRSRGFAVRRGQPALRRVLTARATTDRGSASGSATWCSTWRRSRPRTCSRSRTPSRRRR